MIRNRDSVFAIAGGLAQIAVAAVILFLPVLQICLQQGGEMICQGQSYLQQGGNPIGYVFFVLMIVAGVLAVVSTRIEGRAIAQRLRWLAFLLSISFVIVGAWGVGLAFAPGGLLILLSILVSRERSTTSSTTASMPR